MLPLMVIATLVSLALSIRISCCMTHTFSHHSTTSGIMSSVSSTNTRRTSVGQLLRAAGSKSFQTFHEAVQGWSAEEIDDMNQDRGKTPVHMAAWKGSLENLQYLLDTMQCNAEVVSQGEFSYGKTPIFFALTQSREDVVNYLLEQGACVKIINNKGQSPLSIASSHLSQAAVSRIQAQEQAQASTEWTNYRATHSDGLEYGDLDPRFLDRKLRDTDRVTAHAINPTTRQIRRGNFARNNPGRAREVMPSKQSSPRIQKRQSKARPPSLSEEEEQQLQSAWERLERGLANDEGDPVISSTSKEDLLSQIIHLSVQRRSSWIPEAAARLGNIRGSVEFLESAAKAAAAAAAAKNSSALASSESLSTTLILRLLAQLKDPSRSSRGNSRPEGNIPAAQLTAKRLPTVDWMTDDRWSDACRSVRDLSLTCLENGKPILSLRQSPKFIDSLSQLKELEHALTSEPLIAFDAEWHGQDQVSTLQLAVVGDTAWVVDLLCLDAEYQRHCRSFVRSLFCRKGTILLGFAIGHDVPRLQRYVGGEPLLSTESLLDLQLLWSGRAEMPGLAACVGPFSSLPLSKREQCSDWSRRPLSQEQMEYAGLDAAVLPFLLAEKYRQTITGETDNE